MMRFVLVAWVAFSAPALAETDMRALSDGERLLLGEEVRTVLLEHPEIVERALNPSLYADHIASDLELIAAHAEALFGGKDIALFIGKECPDCERAAAELSALSDARGLSVNTLTLEDNPDLRDALQIDTLPFYVLPELMLRGAMPAPVLERFLDRL